MQVRKWLPSVTSQITVRMLEAQRRKSQELMYITLYNFLLEFLRRMYLPINNVMTHKQVCTDKTLSSFCPEQKTPLTVRLMTAGQ